MKKEIVVSVAGIQFEIDDSEAVEVVTVGTYYYKNGKHYILYEEDNEEQGGIKNRITISPDGIEMKKSGAVTTNMVFQEGKSNVTYYNTSVGTLRIKVDTKSILYSEKEDFLYAKILYFMEVNYVPISECSVEIKIRPR